MSQYMLCNSISTVVNRKKTLEANQLDTDLNRCLTTLDLTVFGYGQILGAGLYVLTGILIHNIAGPLAFLCFLFSGLVVLLNALCYAECATRIPSAGSIYAYTYTNVGELWAFLVGWNLALDYMTGGAVGARSFSGALNALMDNRYSNWTREYLVEIYSIDGVGDYPDLVASLCILIIAGLNSVGAKVSITLNNVGSLVNTCCILVIIIVGITVATSAAWQMSISSGGFVPFGVQGVIEGTAMCLYAFQGYESLAIASEEAVTPRSSIPKAITISIIVTTLIYVLSTLVITSVVPYYQVDIVAPIPLAFAAAGVAWAKSVVAIGSVVGLSNAIIGDLFSGPRTLYAMAADGLVFRIFGQVHPTTQTPVMATIMCATVASVLALFFDTEILLQVTSIGILLSAFMTALNVLLLRYQTPAEAPFQHNPQQNGVIDNRDTTNLLSVAQNPDDIGKLKKRYRNTPIFKVLAFKLGSQEQTVSTAVISEMDIKPHTLETYSSWKICI